VRRVARGVKRRLRDAFWSVKGPRLTNPAVPSPVTHVLFVCKGNICRSPFAEVMAERLLAEHGLTGVRVSSAGFAARMGEHPPKGAREAAAAVGCRLDEHGATLLTEALMQSAELVVVMEFAHVEMLRRRFPREASRVFLLPLFGVSEAARGYARYNFADPYDRSREVFDACYASIRLALGGLIDAIRPR
jgi:protein-tyrosine phosphatase